MRAAQVAAFALLGCGCSPPFHLVPGKSVLLPGQAAAEYRQLCSRPGLPEYESTWEPDRDVIATMERRLNRIHRLRARRCCLVGASVDDVNAYERRYVGIVSKGRRLIYIAAGPDRVCDGGSCCWGVLYDPARNGRFFDLAFNGIG